MKRTLINTAAGALAAVLLCGAGLAWANGVNEGYINEEVLRGNRGVQRQQPYQHYQEYREPTYEEDRRIDEEARRVTEENIRNLPQKYRADLVDGCTQGLADTELSRAQISNVCNCVHEEFVKQFPSAQVYQRTLEADWRGQMSTREKQEFIRKSERAMQICGRRFRNGR
ncbi:hypothetical protein H9Q10_09475 [Eikenella sp. S3360]|uniref:Uncharacterized protein n=1 Tax=Eikenella glucosivorans TaxID=2766967 RepID=A0ABS0NC51_9NEIS|nr:hypothetical protein [Eikenella glucosivorans]MBH5329894.1 hypothetical protein [Eikenella glucosivorans]